MLRKTEKGGDTVKKGFVRLLAAALLVCLLLTGCSGTWLEDMYSLVMRGMMTHFEDMEYVRPDVDAFNDALDGCMEQVPTATKASVLMDSVYEVYQLYYDFTTNYYLANIHYWQDMTDIYWSGEYSYCMERSAEVSAGMDQLLYALADCSLRQELEAEEYFGAGFFDYYDGDSLWDDTFTALMNEEAALLEEYYALNAQAVDAEYYSEEFFSVYGAQMEELFVELVAVRQEIAAYAGYESYPEFAYDFYFYRDYTPEQAMGLVEEIRQELVELYVSMDSSAWQSVYEECSEEQTFEYVRGCAEAMGGTANYAFQAMENAGLYDIAYSQNKYSASFEVFLLSYYTPFIYVCPTLTGQDKLTFAHEFGHFCSDYAAGGSFSGVDVAEVFSQGMEYLSLCYGEDTEALTALKMADSLCVFVEQAAYASFEHQVYSLEGEELTVENVRELYAEIGSSFGFEAYGRDSRDYVLISHFFISPMYVISYVVSNDAAMQIYQAELTEAGAGLALWEDNLATQEMFFLAFLEDAGLESPFAEGRVQQLRAVFESTMK